jgi:hypothetical protein
MTEGGLASWTRVPGTITDPKTAPLPSVKVTDIKQSDGGDQISFHVSRTGVPVLVKISYFPDWHASGAAGPWRAEPNLMVVVPTSKNVTLSYGSSGPGDLGALLTLAGVIGFLLLLRRRSVLVIVDKSMGRSERIALAVQAAVLRVLWRIRIRRRKRSIDREVLGSRV